MRHRWIEALALVYGYAFPVAAAFAPEPWFTAGVVGGAFLIWRLECQFAKLKDKVDI